MSNSNDDILPQGDETPDEWGERLFPQPPDNTIEWLCYCLSPYQAAIVYAMLELNASDMRDKDGSYRQRQQRLWQAMLQADDKQVNENNIKHAKAFVEEHQLW